MRQHPFRVIRNERYTPPVSGDPATMNENFCRWLLVSKGLHDNTIDTYRKISRRFTTWCETDFPTEQHAMDYMAMIYEQGYSKSHIANNALVVETYLAWACHIELKLGRPKKAKARHKEALTEAEVVLFLDAAKDIREKAILTLLACSGIRNEELCRLRVRDVDCATHDVQVMGKGSKERVVYIPGECVKIIMEYLAQYPREKDDYLFSTLRHGNQYSTCALRLLCKTVAARTKIGKRIHPHLLRHAYATNMLANNASIRYVQELLGHSYIETTMIYADASQRRVKQEYRFCRPNYL